jgi:nickel transport protein
MARFCLRIGVLLLLVAVGLPAQAHKVNMFAYAEGNEVFVEGYFADGKKPKFCEVVVYDSGDKPIVTGKTNEEGQFSFVIPVPGPLRIRLDAGEGHVADYKLAADETAQDSGVQAGPLAPIEMSKEGSGSDSVVQSNSGADVAMVQKAVGQSLRPVMRALDELKQRRTISDILGGIGIIMGIGGLFLYLKARKLIDNDKSRKTAE